MRRQPHQGRTLANRRRLLGLTQHDVSQQARIPINRIVFAETGRCDLEPEEVERVWDVFRKRARKAMDAVAS